MFGLHQKIGDGIELESTGSENGTTIKHKQPNLEGTF